MEHNAVHESSTKGTYKTLELRNQGMGKGDGQKEPIWGSGENLSFASFGFFLESPVWTWTSNHDSVRREAPRASHLLFFSCGLGTNLDTLFHAHVFKLTLLSLDHGEQYLR